MNETLKTIAARYSCRDYDARMPDSEALAAIARAAIQAPSGINRQCWQIMIVKDQSLIRDMESEGMRILSEMPDRSMYDRIMSRGGKLFYNAPCMVMIAIKEAQPKGSELIDLGIVAQNIVLAASSLGIDNVHCGLACLPFAGPRAGEFKERLRFPAGYECGMGVLLGYAKTASSPHEPDPAKITIIE